MGNLVDIQHQIEKLQKQAKEIKTREFDRTLQDILEKMQAYGITVNDLRVGKGRLAKSRVKGTAKPAAKADAGKAHAKVPPKYRGPQGETWSGRGLPPRWLAALIEQGQTKDAFLIER